MKTILTVLALLAAGAGARAQSQFHEQPIPPEVIVLTNTIAASAVAPLMAQARPVSGKIEWQAGGAEWRTDRSGTNAAGRLVITTTSVLELTPAQVARLAVMPTNYNLSQILPDSNYRVDSNGDFSVRLNIKP